MKPHITSHALAARMKINRIARTFEARYGFSSHGSKHSRIYSDYGYPQMLDFWFFYNLYKRCGLAFAGVERPADMTWLTKPKIKLDEDTEDEEFKRLARRLVLWPTMHQVDKMQRVGHYAGLIMTVADGKDPKDPVGQITTADVTAVTPAWENQLIINKRDTDRNSPRYGLPDSYSFNNDDNQDIIHWTRVLIWAEGANGNSILGTSAIEPAFNACLDWEKIRGAGAEGFFKQAAMRGWLQDTLKGEVAEQPDPELLEDLAEAMKDMNESFDQVPYLGGMELKNFTASLANPEHFKNAALEDAAAGFKWSAKGLVGSQEGQLAGEQDSSQDRVMAQSRRENFITYKLYEFIEWLSDHCTDFNGERIVEFDDLMAPSDSARLDNAVKMQQINQAGALSSVIPFSAEEIREAAGWSNDEFEEPELPKPEPYPAPESV